MKTITNRRQETKVYTPVESLKTVFLRSLALCLLLAGGSALFNAAEATAGEPFIPDQQAYFASGKSLGHTHWLSQLTRSMNNDALLQTASNVRTNDMSAAHRAHNQEWIRQGADESNESSAKEMVKELLTASVKRYWNDIRETQFSSTSVIPDADGRGQLNIQRMIFDYKVRVSGSRIKLSVQLEF